MRRHWIGTTRHTSTHSSTKLGEHEATCHGPVSVSHRHSKYDQQGSYFFSFPWTGGQVHQTRSTDQRGRWTYSFEMVAHTAALDKGPLLFLFVFRARYPARRGAEGQMEVNRHRVTPFQFTTACLENQSISRDTGPQRSANVLSAISCGNVTCSIAFAIDLAEVGASAIPSRQE